MLFRYSTIFLFIFGVAVSQYVQAEATLTLKQAVAQVRRESGGKILSARTIKTTRGDAYRIKVLTREGRVRVVQISELAKKEQ
jgi:hypothetical protein